LYNNEIIIIIYVATTLQIRVHAFVTTVFSQVVMSSALQSSTILC